jgi:hypothetical protein
MSRNLQTVKYYDFDREAEKKTWLFIHHIFIKLDKHQTLSFNSTCFLLKKNQSTNFPKKKKSHDNQMILEENTYNEKEIAQIH